MTADLDDEVNDDIARLTGNVVDADLIAVALLDLVEQRDRIVVIDKAHRLAVVECFQRTKDGGMAKTLGNATRIKRVYSKFGHDRNSFRKG